MGGTKVKNTKHLEAIVEDFFICCDRVFLNQEMNGFI